MPGPTRDQKSKEAAVLYTSLADLAVVTILFFFAVFTSSLTLLSEAIRVALMLLVEFYGLFVLRALHRDRLRRFRFGIGKVEQMCNLAIGAALLFSGFWVAHSVVAALLSVQAASTPLGLAAAAVISAVNLLINLLGWLAMAAAARDGDSAIYRAQLRARAVKLAASAIVQIAITIAALAKDPVVATLFDGIGAAFVAGVMVTIGFKMVAECLPDLLDHPLPGETKKEIEAALLSAGIAGEELLRLRTRCSGSLPQVELTLAPAGCASVTDYCRRVTAVENHLKDHLGGADVSVVVDARKPAET
ncbi:cation transporter [Pelagibius litoralis]|uniref:Cation transporter n=1 Tax=Pelagibius litoralis TaxID=374515 RepID=A0A967F3D4_9PROT|nr:cation transporter [Pelagibius litoralis]NIA72474.1 cation transporter [Pelagibius litoralis]